MLVVVEHRDVQLGLEPLLNLEASRRAYVLEVYAAETRGECFHRRNDIVGVMSVQTDWPCINAAELFEQERLALHNRQGGFGTDIAEPQHCGTVRDYRNRPTFGCQRPDCILVLMYRHAHAADPGRVGLGHVVAARDRHRRAHLNLATQMEEERRIRDAADNNIGYRANRVDYLLPVFFAGGVNREVAYHPAAAGRHNINRRRIAALLSDSGCYETEHSRPIGILRTQSDAVGYARTWTRHWNNRSRRLLMMLGHATLAN